MIESPQTIRVSHDGVESSATIAWNWDDGDWTVTLTSPELDTVEAREDDAFEALCTIRERLEPLGWRIGVLGAQVDVWPSGMSRDQGGGKSAYRMTAHGAQDRVDTFGPVDPATVTTIAEQRAFIDRLWS